MQKPMVIVAAWAVLAVAAARPISSSAQILEPTAELEKSKRPPLNLQGQIVSLRIVPATTETKVFVTGVPADQLIQPGVGLKAFIRSEGELIPVTANQEGDYFVVETPVTENGVRLDVRVGDEVESFEVEPVK